MNTFSPPSIEETQAQLSHLSSLLVPTPTVEWGELRSMVLPEIPRDTHFKLELFQYSGSFKMRGALSVIDSLTLPQKLAGIVAGTGGNHGIAVAAAAHALGKKEGITIPTTIVVPETMNPFRRSVLERYEVEIVTMPTITDVISRMNSLADERGLTVVHPFENPKITLGTATLGLEFLNQVKGLDVVIVPIGGGGLASGVASIIKQVSPKTEVIGVEPTGAPSMTHSIAQGIPSKLPNPPKSIADSLCAPHSEPYSYQMCQRYIDDIVLVSDEELARAMKVLFEHLKLAVEPAGAAATAALLGPLAGKYSGKRVGIIVCGANIDTTTHNKLITQNYRT
jgi:threonine dehydratase